MALLDLDDLKAFNDAHHHQAGDRLLIGVAAAWDPHARWLLTLGVLSSISPPRR
jgi:predicted signal transduction protein with EAL and GGDEF domain